jgi:hypothetical protein
MELSIETYCDLLDFIKRNEVPTEVAAEVVSKFLKVIILFKNNKTELIEATESHINKFGYNYPLEWEQPIFLNQFEIDVII